MSRVSIAFLMADTKYLIRSNLWKNGLRRAESMVQGNMESAVRKFSEECWLSIGGSFLFTL